MRVVKVIKLDNSKIRYVFGSAVHAIDIDYTLPLHELESMLNYAIEILVSTDPAFSKFKHKNNIRVYSGNNHIDVIQDGVGSLGLLIIEDHSC